MADSKVNDILVFMSVAETGNFTTAGRAFGLSRSTAGKAVTRLEDRYGARLLNRTTRAVSLTEAGQRLYAKGEAIRVAIAAADAAFAMASGQPLIARHGVSNGFKEVPSILEEVIAVNRDNLFETVVRDGFHREEDLR